MLTYLTYLAFFSVDWSSIVQQVKNGQFYYLLIILPLMPINWLLEGLKWQILLKQSYAMSLSKAWASVFSGVAIGSMTPNRVGSFLGRLFWLPPEKRVDGTVHTFYSNWAQLIVTLFMGGWGLLYFHFKTLLPDYINLSSILVFFVLITLMLIFYLFPAFIWRWVRRFFGFNNPARLDRLFYWEQKNKSWVLFLSFVRYCVFLSQFAAAIYLYQIPIALTDTLAAITATFLFTTFIPSLLFGKLVIRESVAVFCFSFFVTNEPIIVVTSLTIWLVNIFLPAIIGTVLLSRAQKSYAQ